jgi:hypothetical protein
VSWLENDEFMSLLKAIDLYKQIAIGAMNLLSGANEYPG